MTKSLIDIFFIAAIGLSWRELTSGMPSVKTIEEAMLTLPKPELVMMRRLRALVQDCLPQAREEPKFGLGVPYYSRHRQICFIWPSSYSWSPKSKDTAVKPGMVTLGFCQGNLMSNEDGVLKSEGRKQVYCMYFKSVGEINDQQIRALLYEAELIDNGFGKKDVKKKK